MKEKLTVASNKMRQGDSSVFRKRSLFLMGYTMVEILIVTVIIGVIATLVLPRLTGNTPRFRNSEAVNMLGAMRRAMLAYMDQQGIPGDEEPFESDAGCKVGKNKSGACVPSSAWTEIGLGPVTSPFDYNINDDELTATRRADKGFITMDLGTGKFVCAGGLRNVLDAGNKVIACDG